MRSVWKPANALSTRCVWSARAFASSVQAVGTERAGAEECCGEAVADGLGVGVAVGLVVADGLAVAVGVGDGSVSTIVVTPLDAETLTSAPVAPSRNTPEMAPAFAWISSERALRAFRLLGGCYTV